MPRAVYLLPFAFGWELVDIIEVDSLDEFERHIIVNLTRTVPSTELAEGWWKKEVYCLKISPWGYEILESPASVTQ